MSPVFFLHLLLPVLAMAEMSWSEMAPWVFTSEDKVSQILRQRHSWMNRAQIRPITHSAKAEARSEVRSSNHAAKLNSKHIYPEAKALHSFSLPHYKQWLINVMGHISTMPTSQQTKVLVQYVFFRN